MHSLRFRCDKIKIYDKYFAGNIETCAITVQSARMQKQKHRFSIFYQEKHCLIFRFDGINNNGIFCLLLIYMLYMVSTKI